MNLRQLLLTVFIVFFSLNSYTQNTRIQDRNQIRFQFNKKIRIEGGFFNQILQLPREILMQGQPNSRNVFQHNTGFIINTFLTIDCKKVR